MSSTGNKLPRRFYEAPDVVEISRRLLGKVLCTMHDGVVTAGLICETEAYCGRNDKACHANDGLRTARTEVMYGPPGHAYVYLCYGIHHLFNVVTNRQELADAVLIRSVRPLDGADLMSRRRHMQELKPVVSNGPGKLTQALGITTVDDGADLLGNRIWIENRGFRVPAETIAATPRVGVGYAGEHSRRPWRFIINGSEWVSR